MDAAGPEITRQFSKTPTCASAIVGAQDLVMSLERGKCPVQGTLENFPTSNSGGLPRDLARFVHREQWEGTLAS